jgi:hypothetical protein
MEDGAAAWMVRIIPVSLNILSSDNRISLQNSTLKVNVGGQSNLRMEDEGGGETSLKMLLSSGLYNVQWVKPLSTKTQFVVGNNFLFQNNTNYGKRVIIPDANTVESGASVYVRNTSGKFILEAGTGFSCEKHCYERDTRRYLPGSWRIRDTRSTVQ